MIRCVCGRECRHICPDCKKELSAANGNTLNPVVRFCRWLILRWLHGHALKALRMKLYWAESSAVWSKQWNSLDAKWNPEGKI